MIWFRNWMTYCIEWINYSFYAFLYMYTRYVYTVIIVFRVRIHNKQIKGYIDDERQFKTAKHLRWRHCSEAVFCDNFVIFRRRAKRIAFLNQWIFLRVSICKFSIFVMDVTTFWHPSGAYICQMPGHRLSRLAKGRVSAFHRYYWFGVKNVSCSLCAG